MSTMDFNDAEPQRGGFNLIPEDTVALVVASLRPGQAGPGGWLKQNNDRTCLMADFEFVIDGGEYDRRKFWGLMITEGQTDGQQKAANITRSRLRAALESAHGIMPGDDSPAAMEKRHVSGWQSFDGLKFCVRLGIEEGKPKSRDLPNGEKYPDKNVIKAVVTPDEPDYISPGPQAQRTSGGAVSAASNSNSGAAKPAAGANKPAWAS